MYSSSDFSRAHEMWIQPPEYSTPDYDEWLDGQDEKDRIIKRFNVMNETDITNIDEMDEEIALMDVVPEEIKTMREELAKLEDDFPCEYPDMDGE
jgi:hypothetical protein